MITEQRPQLLEDVEKLLKGDSVSEGIRCIKAKAL